MGNPRGRTADGDGARLRLDCNAGRHRRIRGRHGHHWQGQDGDFNEPTLKSAEINVETFKGVVQLSGFVSSATAETTAVAVARNVGGVKSVKNDMRLK
jgi:hypothetical protein